MDEILEETLKELNNISEKVWGKKFNNLNSIEAKDTCIQLHRNMIMKHQANIQNGAYDDDDY